QVSGAALMSRQIFDRTPSKEQNNPRAVEMVPPRVMGLVDVTFEEYRPTVLSLQFPRTTCP
ncbi:MAG: hypothetical protein ACRCZD_06210, partial [Phycicoccus sp.]